MTREALAPAIEASARHMAQHLVREALAKTQALLAKVGRLCCRTLSACACSCIRLHTLKIYFWLLFFNFVSVHDKLLSPPHSRSQLSSKMFLLCLCTCSCTHLHTLKVYFYFVCTHLHTLKVYFYFVCTHLHTLKVYFCMHPSPHTKSLRLFCMHSSPHTKSLLLFCMHSSPHTKSLLLYALISTH